FWVVLGINCGKAFRYHAQVAGGGPQAHSRSEPAKCPDILENARWLTAVQAERQPNVFATKQESRWHDSDQRSRLAVKCEHAANHLGIAVEFFLPEAVAHHRNRRSIRAAIVWDDGTAMKGMDPKKFECVCRRLAAVDLACAVI